MGSSSAQSMMNNLEKVETDDVQQSTVDQNESAKNYQPLCRAIVERDWERVNNFLKTSPDAIKEGITEEEDTPLIFAVKRGVEIHFLEKLMSPEVLATQNLLGNTALHAAAGRGNTEAAKLFVTQKPSLINIRNYGRSLPVHLAAMHGKRMMTEYLLDLTIQDHKKQKTSESVSGTKLTIQDHKEQTTSEDVSGPKLTIQDHKEQITSEVASGPKLTLQYHKEQKTSAGVKGSGPTIQDKEQNPFQGVSGSSLIHHVINARFYDMAFQLLQLNPELAWKPECPLKMMAQDPSTFPSGLRFSAWQNLIYCCAPLELKNLSISHNIEKVESLADCSEVQQQNLNATPLKSESSSISLNRKDEENPPDNSEVQQKILHGYQKIHAMFWNRLVRLATGFQRLHAMFWNILERIVTHIKPIRDKKLLLHQRVQLVRRICKKVVSLDDTEAYSILREPFLLAAKYGIHEVVEVISGEFPSAIGFKDENNHTAFHLAIMYRHANVFNFINQCGGHEEFLSGSLDNEGNNILHLAGRLAREKRLNLTSAAILQVQSELQWYKEVEKLVLPAQRESKNNDEKTPLMVFIGEHSDMITKEEQWMKGMANSCTVAATLIGAVAFAAAITVPGGNNDEGFPIFTEEAAFMIFNISNTLALFSSLSTVIVFLAILISRYAVIDFLYALPKRLIMGLLALFLSVTSMIISFSAAIYLVSRQREVTIILEALLACIPVALFVFLQFPLLLNMIKSTYFPRIFSSHKESREY